LTHGDDIARLRSIHLCLHTRKPACDIVPAHQPDMAETVTRQTMSNRPKIILTSQDLERLEDLLESLPENAIPGKAALRAELDRAEIVEPEQIPPSVVTMNSTVRFSIDSSGEDFCLSLVYPRDVDGSGEKISILAPVGSALLGLSTGDEIEWPKPGGGTIRVRIVEIISQPEREGKYYR
jgi:regulator of nucleoside diphosphate kinase